MKTLVICGATASGKTSLAVECAIKLNSEIISADSQLIYKGLNIGTAKPTIKEMKGIKHHLIDIVDAKSAFSVFDYMQAAEPILNNLLHSGKIPVVCGGTGFYINSLLFNFSYGNTASDSIIREKYIKLCEKEGKEFVYDILMKSDPETAKKLHVNDVKRVIRALEIYESSGSRKSEIIDAKISKRDYLAVAINYPREELYERINKRVDNMFDDGLVAEVENLLKSGLTEAHQSMQAIGYKEVVQGLKNHVNESTMRDIIKQNTRHYAKRQITFFKKLPDLKWLSPDEATAENVAELLNE